jgi:hypothetical protein
MLQRALEALEEQETDERHFNSLTLRIDPAKLPAVKEQLLKFLKNFHFENEDAGANAVYQLSLQLFEHTKDLKITMPRGKNEIQH